MMEKLIKKIEKYEDVLKCYFEHTPKKLKTMGVEVRYLQEDTTDDCYLIKKGGEEYLLHLGGNVIEMYKAKGGEGIGYPIYLKLTKERAKTSLG